MINSFVGTGTQSVRTSRDGGRNSFSPHNPTGRRYARPGSTVHARYEDRRDENQTLPHNDQTVSRRLPFSHHEDRGLNL